MSEIKTVGVVGAGTMGSGIAHVFARAGFNVVLCDVEMVLLERAVERIRAEVPECAEVADLLAFMERSERGFVK